jgi:hypothetical protein
MLTREQWQWLADNHAKVRRVSMNVLAILFLIYVALIFKTIWDKGKAPIPFQSQTDFRGKYDCATKLTPFNIGPFGGSTPSKEGYYNDASLFRLERHETFVTDVEALKLYPECVGAFLADNIDNPNPAVFILYDTKKKRAVYRLAHIDDAVKK